MTAEPAQLARNTGIFTIALVAQKVISFLYFTYLARLLGPASLGKYVLALSITTMFSVLMDLGLSSILIREVSRDNTKASHYLSHIFGFKIAVGLVVAALVAITANLLGYPELTKELIYLAIIIMVVDSFILTIYSTLRSFHNLVWESIGSIFFQFCVSTIGFVISLITKDLRWLMSALVIGVFINFTYAKYQLKHKYQVSFKPQFSKVVWLEMLRSAWPFAAAAILVKIYGYIDTVLLSILSSEHAVGLYSVAYKVTFALQFIPTAFSASLFPAFSNYYVSDKYRLTKVFQNSVIYLTAISVPISFGIISLAQPIVHNIYPAYTDAIVPLQILIFSLVFLFITFPLGALIAGCNKQEKNTLNMGLAALTSLVANSILIPKFGPTGAAIASLISTLVLLIAGFVVASKIIKPTNLQTNIRLGKILLSGLLMSLVIYLLEALVPWYLLIIVGAAMYSFVLLLSKGVSIDEIKGFIGVIRSKA